MKSLNSLFLLLILSCTALMAQEHTQNEHLPGRCTRAQLEEAPYEGWYKEEYGAYIPDEAVIQKLKKAGFKRV